MIDRTDILRMAREERLLPDNSHPAPQTPYMADKEARLTRFAALVAAAEREACAKVCEDIADTNRWSDAVAAAAAIRARSNHDKT